MAMILEARRGSRPVAAKYSRQLVSLARGEDGPRAFHKALEKLQEPWPLMILGFGLGVGLFFA